MNEKEMIEEMAKDLNSSIAMMTNENFSGCLDIARFLTDLGYRKIPEGSVVLSKEELRNLTNKVFVEHLMEVTKRQAEEREMLYEWLSQARKETAKEIIKFVSEHCDNESLIWLLDEFAEKYGVEE